MTEPHCLTAVCLFSYDCGHDSAMLHVNSPVVFIIISTPPAAADTTAAKNIYIYICIYIYVFFDRQIERSIDRQFDR